MLALDTDARMNRFTNAPVAAKATNQDQQHPNTTGLTNSSHQYYHQHKQQQRQQSKQKRCQQQPKQASLFSSATEHYIHSRLKSALGSGRKEVMYSGVLEGGRVRRVASLNAQAMNQMLCLTESALPVLSLTKACTGNSTVCSPAVHDVDVLQDGPENRSFAESVEDCPLEVEDCQLESTAANSMMGVVETPTSCERTTTPDLDCLYSPLSASSLSSSLSPSSVTATNSLPLEASLKANMKNASLQIVDVMKVKSKTRRTVNQKKGSTPVVDHNSGFVKRLASLNAQACVAAIVGSNRHVGGSQAEGAVAGKKRLRSSRNSNHNNSKKLKVAQDEGGVCAEVSKGEADGGDSSDGDDGATSNQNPVSLQQGITNQSSAGQKGSLVCATNHGCSESVSSSSEDTNYDERQNRWNSQSCSLQSVLFNTLGLLYSGDCVSANKSILLTTEGRLPDRVMPLIVPLQGFEVSLAMDRVLKQTERPISKRKTKGNNGWSIIGDPIKAITIRGEEGSSVNRKYFMGIRRRNERLFVRDSVLLRSSKKNDNPYVAKISSIWQESSSRPIMMTVFWYYRSEDTSKPVSAMFHEGELMASQHHDDVSVACVDDKCLVLGFSQYCRYMAAKKRKDSQIPHKPSIVPSLHPHQDDSSSHYLQYQGAGHTACNDREVYFCYRAYNHFTEKVLRAASISYK